MASLGLLTGKEEERAARRFERSRCAPFVETSPAPDPHFAPAPSSCSGVLLPPIHRNRINRYIGTNQESSCTLTIFFVCISSSAYRVRGQYSLTFIHRVFVTHIHTKTYMYQRIYAMKNTTNVFIDLAPS